MECILNLLPITEGERERFLATALGYEHLFRPVEDSRPGAGIATPDDFARAAIILGCPSGGELAGAHGLKWLQTWSAGADAYLKPGVLPEGAMLTSAIGAYGPSVSEHMLAMLLALQTHLPRYRDLQRTGCADDLGSPQSLRGTTVLVLGAGDIGSSFAVLCKALGAGRILGVRRDLTKPSPGVDELHALTEVDSLLPLANVVAMALPRSPETDRLMDARRLDLMRPDAILLNAGRGTAVDCDALAIVLAAGRLWGAGLDVTDPEPLPHGHPLWTEPRALLTPHVAGGNQLESTRSAFVAIALENLRRYLAGEPLRNRFR